MGDNDDPIPPPVSSCLPRSCGQSGGEELNWPHRETEGERGGRVGKIGKSASGFYSSEVT